ncbi:MAG: nuclear transport factor 2 family protein [Leadbetterella sp.]|nr:nuclear transport factor 2 family protein [Leadbetterella sp.]
MKSVTSESSSVLTRKGTCIEFFSAYQEHDYQRMVNLCTSGATVDFIPLGDNGKGRVAELGKNLWALLMECFPDIDNTIDTFSTEGDEVTCKVCIFGTQAKDFAGIPSKGLKFESDHIFIFRFDETDKITGISINWDHASFSRQLGAN